MLSTLSNLLPSLSSDPPPPPPAPATAPAAGDDKTGMAAPRASIDKQPPKEKPSAIRVQHETFIVVRPPPSKSNHPLNLQLQLIPPAVQPTATATTAHTKERSAPSRRSVDLSQDSSAASTADEDKLRRRSSTSSTRSADSASLYSTSSSVGSSASFASSSSSRRIIVPLYNLSAHNVMTNSILDAGTDAKIAKFLKRGLEIIDLCVIEPTEIWGAKGGGMPTAAVAAAAAAGQGHDRTSVSNGGNAHGSSPDNSSIASSEQLSVPEPIVASPTPKRSRFASLFNRKTTPAAPSVLPKSPLIATSDLPKTPKPADPAPPQLSPPVLGLQASLYSAVYPPQGKSPASIVWVVRKWIKGGDSGLLGGLQRLGVSTRTPAAPQLPTVRFEWVRGAPARAPDTATHSRLPTTDTTVPTGSINQSRRSSHIVSQPQSPAAKSLDLASTSTTDAADARSESLTQETDDGESDQEDSETPWTCTLVISLPGDVSPSPSDLSVNRTNRTSILSGHSGDAIHPSHLGVSARPSPKSFRLRVATLAPTPHHPKVVAQLKMPWPLPDVDILHGVARKRPAGAPLMNDEVGPEGGLIVTAEELKDIVCTSAFWMIVRENFGGIQKKTRKGDGWNIRG